MGEHDKLKTVPVGDRPYEKMLKFGPESLSDSELLGIIIRSGTKNKNVIQCAQNLLLTFDGKLDKCISASVAQLKEIEGIGTTKAIQLKAVCEIGRRLNMSGFQEKLDGSNPDNIGKTLMTLIGKKQQEVFMVVALDKRLKVLKTSEISVGTLDRTIAHPREIFQMAIRELAYAIIVAHNHPSGELSPSGEDLLLTKQLVEAGNIIGIPVLDHIIVSGNDYHSMKIHGELER